MQRRDFAKSVIFGVTAASVLPVVGKAADADANENVIFTESQPGHWAKPWLHMFLRPLWPTARWQSKRHTR